MFKVYSKDNCPFCERAKALLIKLEIPFDEIKVTEPSQLPKPQFRTVPQVVHRDGTFIGGFTELEVWSKSTINVTNAKGIGMLIPEGYSMVSSSVEIPERKTTVFNVHNTGHLTGNYPLFLGEELGFSDTINQPYPELETLFLEQSAQIWGHTEIDLTQDRQDMLTAPQELVDLMVQNITWQSLADSVASRAIGSVLMSNISNSTLQDLYNAIIFFESIHTLTYQHIIRQTFVDPNQALIQGYSNLQAIKRSNVLVEAFDNLANSSTNSIEEKRKLVLFCVIAMYLLESINFPASFAVTFAIAERGWFQGISQDVVLIARDESLHARAGAVVLNIVKKQWPETFEALKPQLKDMLRSVVEDEYAWADHLFSNGRQVIGLNAQLLKEYVDYCAMPVAETLGIEPLKEIKDLPLPYMKDYLDSSRMQLAAQEIQLTSYLVNSVKSVSEEEMNTCLADLRKQYNV